MVTTSERDASDSVLREVLRRHLRVQVRTRALAASFRATSRCRDLSARARARERREVFPSGAARERDGSEIVLDASARRVPRLRRDRRLRAEPGRSRASASPSPTVSPRAGARATLESRPPKSRTDPSALSSLALLTQARRAPARHRQALAEGSSPVRGAFAGRYPDHVVPERGFPSSHLASSGNLRSGVFF